jgi:hypothetical protein
LEAVTAFYFPSTEIRTHSNMFLVSFENRLALTADIEVEPHSPAYCHHFLPSPSLLHQRERWPLQQHGRSKLQRHGLP